MIPGTPYHALVLAGSRGVDDPVARAGGRSHKAFVPIAGQVMVERVIATLRAAPSIRSIAVAIESSAPLAEAPGLGALLRDGTIERAPCAQTPARTVMAALAARPATLPLLVVTADHPLLSVEMIEYFLRHAATGADLAVGLAPAELVLRAFPRTRRTLLRFADGACCGCNLFAFNGSAAAAAAGYWTAVEQQRKRPWRLMRAFGIGNLLRYAFGALSLERAFSHASKVLGLRVAAVRMPFAEAAVDVDTESDLALVEAVLRARERTPAPP
jgi:GTP:adenosylcobinamide-phosphate guanylyltransferase